MKLSNNEKGNINFLNQYHLHLIVKERNSQKTRLMCIFTEEAEHTTEKFAIFFCFHRFKLRLEVGENEIIRE
jgi:hypothetical protein